MQTIQEIRKSTGMSQSQFSEYFEIPLGTLQNWEHNRRQPPKYVIKLIQKVLRTDNLCLDGVTYG